MLTLYVIEYVTNARVVQRVFDTQREARASGRAALANQDVGAVVVWAYASEMSAKQALLCMMDRKEWWTHRTPVAILAPTGSRISRLPRVGP